MSGVTARQWREAALALRNHAAEFERRAEQAVGSDAQLWAVREHLQRIEQEARSIPGDSSPNDIADTIASIARTALGELGVQREAGDG